MRINQNISAMNTYSRLTAANTSKSKSLEKLSSGLRINRAGDDAAGLAISEKMRGQIGGLKQAVRNAQDGISLIQTAEGALNETHSILNRMRELAVQASTGTNTESDRAEIQKEIDQLATEITRISTDTEFNTQKLLDGSFTTKFHIGANSGQNMALDIVDLGATALKVGRVITDDEAAAAAAAKLTGTDISSIFETKLDNIGDLTVNGQAVALTNTKALDGSSGALTIDDIKTALQSDLDAVFDGTDHDGVEFTVEAEGDALVITSSVVGADSTVTIGGAAATTLGIAGSANGTDEIKAGTYGIDVSTQEAADAAIKVIDNATQMVSAERSKLGAVQNRLEHTINNLTATAENLSAAESRIRDVDMAEEIMEFTKNNILSQAATSMLAQANQMPNSVLQLLQ